MSSKHTSALQQRARRQTTTHNYWSDISAAYQEDFGTHEADDVVFDPVTRRLVLVHKTKGPTNDVGPVKPF